MRIAQRFVLLLALQSSVLIAGCRGFYNSGITSCYEWKREGGGIVTIVIYPDSSCRVDWIGDGGLNGSSVEYGKAAIASKGITISTINTDSLLVLENRNLDVQGTSIYVCDSVGPLFHVLVSVNEEIVGATNDSGMLYIDGSIGRSTLSVGTSSDMYYPPIFVNGDTNNYFEIFVGYDLCGYNSKKIYSLEVKRRGVRMLMSCAYRVLGSPGNVVGFDCFGFDDFYFRKTENCE